MAQKQLKEKIDYITKGTIIDVYGFTEQMIDEFLPPPLLRRNPHYSCAPQMKLWDRKVVESTLQTPECKAAIERLKARKRKKEESQQKIQSLLMGFDYEHMLKYARTLSRQIILHVGPTNSGKTYQAIQALKKAKTGAYLGPLRLLALEMFDTLNSDGYPCSLLTGEEAIDVPFAGLCASTIELCDYNMCYDTVVIDEAQLIADPFRGANWTKAILTVKAKELHVCLAPEALPLIEGMIKSFDGKYRIEHHERLTPLVFSGVFRGLDDVQPGDALITFSRKGVLGIAAELERKGIQASVIYGALPPSSRRDEVRRFTNHETKVVVATDAIGMGVSLPIKRVIFCTTQKFDGKTMRTLDIGEIKQIAGRAGRFGIYDRGEVLTMENPHIVKMALQTTTPEIDTFTIPFPEESLSSTYSISTLLKEWAKLPQSDIFVRANMEEAKTLYDRIKGLNLGVDKARTFQFITCPVDTHNEGLVSYWAECCKALSMGNPVPDPHFGTYTLEGCENRYKALDIKHQLLRKVGIEDDSIKEKEELCKKINAFLIKNKSGFLRRCSCCNQPLPINYSYGMCEDCYNRQRTFRGGWDDDDDDFQFIPKRKNRR